MAGWTTIPVLRVDRHVSGVDFLVSNALGARGHDFEIVVSGQPWDAVRAGHSHLVLGECIVRLKLLQRDWPVEQIGAGDIAVDGAGAELVVLETQRCAGPMVTPLLKRRATVVTPVGWHCWPVSSTTWVERCLIAAVYSDRAQV